MAKKLTKHHLIPKVRKQDYKKKKVLDVNRTLKLWEEKHQAWHVLFRCMTIDEIILVLHRVRRIKFDEEFKIKGPVTHY